MNIDKSTKLFEEAIQIIPGGVNSPVRAFKSVGGNPLFIQRGEGSKLFDVDGNITNEATHDFLVKFMVAFAAWVAKNSTDNS